MESMPKYKNYTPGSMSWEDGFCGPRGNVGFTMLADYEKAKLIVDELIKSGKAIERAEMGLDGDWGENSQTIFDGANYFQYEMYDHSIWAEPILIVFYPDGSNEVYSIWNKKQKQ